MAYLLGAINIVGLVLVLIIGSLTLISLLIRLIPEGLKQPISKEVGYLWGATGSGKVLLLALLIVLMRVGLRVFLNL